jgi:hypothetical protein
MRNSGARILRSVVLLCAVLAVVSGRGNAQELNQPGIRAVHAIVPPQIDGLLDDAVWAGQPMAGEQWVSYNPLRGEPAAQRTHVWVAYDESAIYFAFRCFDPEPDKIRATISRRDNVWNDDWVGVSLDSTAAGQVAYHMFVNPSGIQMDALNSSSSGEDTAPDWRWQSAGRIDGSGYVVEIRLPLESIRFRGGMDVGMRVLFFRRNSRLGLSWSWPALPPGKWVFESNAPLAFAELHQPRVLEVIPSTTVARNEQRADGAWSRTADENVGASVKYGITSTITLDATVNPDFSQVESDAFQLQINQRFPIFFGEKRPFFMEGLGLLNLAGTGGDGTMRTAVHTRRIIQPGAGVKVTGNAGDYSFAALSTGDKSYGVEGQKAFTIGRAVRNLGKGQYVGVLVTDTEHHDSFNRVVAADLALRHSDRFDWNASVMLADTADDLGRRKRDAGSQATYGYNTHRFSLGGQIEHFGRDFQMDTAFLNRVGVTRGWQYGELQFYPAASRHGWIKRVAPFVWAMGAYDDIQGGPERFGIGGLRLDFTRQGRLRVDVGQGSETFAHQRFTSGRRHVDGGAQFTRWLNISGNIDRGPGTFYDPAAPYAGTERSYGITFGLQPTANLNQNLAYRYSAFDRRSDGAQVYGVHIVNLRNTYQFTPQFLLRAIVQLDTSQRRMLGDFLASYELVPGTVVHVGYGSILERAVYEQYRPTARGFFFKASYLARL